MCPPTPYPPSLRTSSSSARPPPSAAEGQQPRAAASPLDRAIAGVTSRLAIGLSVGVKCAIISQLLDPTQKFNNTPATLKSKRRAAPTTNRKRTPKPVSRFYNGLLVSHQTGHFPLFFFLVAAKIQQVKGAQRTRATTTTTTTTKMLLWKDFGPLDLPLQRTCSLFPCISSFLFFTLILSLIIYMNI